MCRSERERFLSERNDGIRRKSEMPVISEIFRIISESAPPTGIRHVEALTVEERYVTLSSCAKANQ